MGMVKGLSDAVGSLASVVVVSANVVNTSLDSVNHLAIAGNVKSAAWLKDVQRETTFLAVDSLARIRSEVKGSIARRIVAEQVALQDPVYAKAFEMAEEMLKDVEVL